jgi:ATP-dependent helicase/nuclease subunit A
MDFTPEQREAITTHDRNLIVVAGAGSGKTRVLVERYLALLDSRPDWPLNALVAITFTRKAAAEMRDRVRQALEARRQKAIGKGNEAALQRWSDLLAAMDSARIDTIHGLCSTLLRANAAEAGIDPSFEVLDDVQARTIREDAVEAAVKAATSADPDTPLGRLFAHYDPQQIRRVLNDAALFAVDLPELTGDLMSLWQQEWSHGWDEAINRLLEQVRPHLNWEPIKDGDGLSEKWRECSAYLVRLAQEVDRAERLRTLTELQGMHKPGKPAGIWGGDGEVAKADLGKIIDAAKKTLTRIGDAPGELDARSADLLPGWAALIKLAQGHYSQAKRRQAVLDFDDLERLTAQLLHEQPEVAARYRGREFRHLLVDEFQDTNQSQWQIVQALTGLEVPGSLFVVGDPKQSIYAFRGADVSVFGSVRAQILDQRGREVLLADSFRTHQPLVEHFNRVFGKLLVRDEYSPVRDYQVELGAPMRAFRTQPPHEAPCVELVLIDGKAAEAETGEKYGSEACRHWEAYELAERLHRMVEAGHPVRDRNGDDPSACRPLEYGDVAILFQSLANVGIYERVFRARGLPFMTIAGRGYYGKQEVYDLLNLLRALHRPVDDLSLASALRSPLFALSDDALYALRLTGLPLWEALDQPGDLVPEDEAAQVAAARDCVYRLRAVAGRVTISELLRMALDETGFLAALTGLPDGTQRRSNVEKLLDLAQSSGRVTLGAFQAYLHDLSAREVREGEALLEAEGVVRIMTVHASKGLEFPVVVLADASWLRGGGGGSDTLLYDGGLACKVIGADGKAASPFAYRSAADRASAREEAERRRLLYVAATRAEDHLIISGQVSEDKKEEKYKAKGWLGWLLESIDERDSAVAWHWPDQPPQAADLVASGEMRRSTGRPLWSNEKVEAGQRLDGPVSAPPLLRQITVRRSVQIRHLAATAIEDLGSAEAVPDDEERRRHRDRFKRRVLYDAPTMIRPVTPRQERRVTSRQIGEIVHEALRWWQPPYDHKPLAERRALLRSYAWAQGITAEGDTWSAIEQAEGFIHKFMKSELYGWLMGSPAVYRELPFIYERDQHIIHGVIDVLFRRADGQWILADYKTSFAGKNAGLATLEQHARRYHLQVAVYAAAVQQQIGVVPQVYIHYVRYGIPVAIGQDQWQAALTASLDQRIEALIESVAVEQRNID